MTKTTKTTTRAKTKTKAKPAKRPEQSLKASARAEPGGDGASVVPAKYRERYKEYGGSSGDDVAVRLRKLLETDDGTIDVAKLRALAEANGVWSDRYAALNAGLQRMTLSNRLRALARKGVAIKWGAK